jgi:hypothetical protein
MRYQQFASHAYCGAAGPVSKMASQQEKAFCVLRSEVSTSVITVQREFRARFKKGIIFVYALYIYVYICKMPFGKSLKISENLVV